MKEAKMKVLGKCVHCGGEATIKTQAMLGPNKFTDPVLVCQGCLSKELPPGPAKREDRKHLVQSAAYWYKSAHLSFRSHGGAVFAMENAYNHVENALAAALRQLHSLSAAYELDGGNMEEVQKFLEEFPEFKP
jgi:hypothetical protein